MDRVGGGLLWCEGNCGLGLGGVVCVWCDWVCGGGLGGWLGSLVGRGGVWDNGWRNLGGYDFWGGGVFTFFGFDG